MRLLGTGEPRSQQNRNTSLQGSLGPDAWTEGMHLEIPETTVLDNPYTYTEWDAGSAQWKGGARGDGTA